MNKTKLGISANAYAALTFLAGLLGIIPTLIMAGVILFVEDNDWLKRLVTKAVVFVLLIGAFSAGASCLTYFFDIIRNLFGVLNITISFAIVHSVISIIKNVICVISNVGLIWFAIQAYGCKYVQIPIIDNIIDKNM